MCTCVSHRSSDAQVVRLSEPAPGDADLKFDDNGYAASYLTQFLVLTWKNHKQYWRNPDVSLREVLRIIAWRMAMCSNETFLPQFTPP